ncbi:MAG: ABC transporter permease [Caldilineaceae bacterium]|nr:ABC transporter permease [Caldilineaceae bacterium]
MKENGLLLPAAAPYIDRKDEAKKAPQRRIRFDLLSIPFVLAGLIMLWGGLVHWQGYPAFILPGPAQVWNKAVTMAQTGILWKHAQVTLIEIGLGLLIGLSLALLLGYLLGKSQTLDRLLSPYIVASQTIPIVAVAPLLVIWFGSGITSKILICALIVFFPTLVSTMVGIRGVDADLRDLMRSLRANRWQIFTKLELPAALPVLFGGLKLSVILSVVGAVVGEFVGADVGLGFLINLGRGVLDTPMIFVAVLALVIIAQLLYLIVSLLESHFLRWRQ